MENSTNEIRLDLMVKGTEKTFTQSFVPFQKALEYTEQEAKLFKTDEEGNELKPTEKEMAKFRADFVASLFNDKDLTGDLILNGIDSLDKDKIMDIILFRVLGYEKPNVTDPKDLGKL